MMLGGGGFLLVASYAGWPQALLAAAAVILFLTLPILAIHEPPRHPAQVGAHRPSLLHALRRRQVAQGLILLLLGGVGVRLTFGMLGPLLLDHGARMEQLGWLFGTFSILAGLAGAFVGGALVRRAPGWRAVWPVVGLEACVLGASQTILIALVGLMFAAMACIWVTLYSALMEISSPLQAGVDFTLFQSADALLSATSGVAAGWLAGRWGYGVCFGVASASMLLATFVIRHVAQSNLASATQEAVLVHTKP